MNEHNRQYLLLMILFILGVTAFFMVRPQKAKGEFDMTGLNQQVQRHEEVLDNHEARITNVESDVQAVQTNTNTAPAPTRQEVPPVVTPEPEPYQTPVAEPEATPYATPTSNQNSNVELKSCLKERDGKTEEVPCP